MGQQVKILPIENVLAPKEQAVTRNNRHNTGSPARPPASFSRATKQRLRCHRQPLKQYPLSRPLLGVLEPSWSRLIGRRRAPPQGSRAPPQPVVLHFQGLPVACGWVGGGGGCRDYDSQKALHRGRDHN